jgi:hypothetical protein
MRRVCDAFLATANDTCLHVCISLVVQVAKHVEHVEVHGKHLVKVSNSISGPPSSLGHDSPDTPDE